MKYLFTLCFLFSVLSVSSQPPNDDPCSATPVLLGDCTSGTTIDADVNYNIPDCNASNYENAVFYSYTLGPLTNKLIVEIDTNSITGEMGAMLLSFPNGCTEEAFLAGANTFYCGAPTDSLSFDGLIPGTTVYLMISSSLSGAGSISGMCFTEIEGAPPCDVNVDCASATVINIPQPDTLICLSGCTDDMPPVDLSACGGIVAPTAWFTFNTGPNNNAEFEISSTDFDDPVIVLVTNCNSIIACDAVNTPLIPNTTYQVLISDGQAATGNFELCVKLSTVISPCITEESLIITATSMSSPLNGPYEPGEVITFKYSTIFNAGGNCQWIHNFIPYLSDCWQGTIPELIDGPEGTSVPATIDWFPAGSTHWKPITNNPPSAMGIDANGRICLIGAPGCTPFTGGGDCSDIGTPMPAGWVVTTPSGTCGGSSIPNESWGIPQGCGLDASKTLFFTLKIPENSSVCNDPEGFVVGLAAFTDGCTGGWANPLCNGNGFIKINLPVNTCEFPVMDVESADMEICSGETFNANFNLDPSNSTIEWTVINNLGINGAEDGAGTGISQVLENTNLSPQTVRYFIYPVSADSCYGEVTILNVTVLPGINNNVADISLCNEGIVNIKSIPTGGSGADYGFIWSTGEIDVDSISFVAVNDTFIILTLIDGVGCAQSDTIWINVSFTDPVVKPADTSLIGNLSFPGNSTQIFSIDPFQNAEDYVWTMDGIEIGQGLSVEYNFGINASGPRTLCVRASNCLPDDQEICWQLNVTLGKNDLPEQTYKIYPNPNNGRFIIELPSILEGTAEIYDLNGRRVYIKQLDKNILNQEVKIDHLPASLYNILVRNKDGKVMGINKLILHE